MALPPSLAALLISSVAVSCVLGRISQKPRHLSPHEERVVLVTGAAGFIGFHISQQLVKEWRVKQVVVVDTFNNYYDVQLKRDRATELVKMGVKVYQADVCDGVFVRYLMHKYNFTDVVHMAAQAGVRYSLEDPQAYVTANYQCFISLLDVLLDFPSTYLVYASSSSVYGKRASIPFSSEEPLRAPGNLYAASKIMDEHLAAAYCSQHGLLATGLRFFTVYGPWGRPDMAAYKFAESIVTGQPVPLFDAGPDHKLKRDFTYVEDIVRGVLAAMDYTPTRCGEAYNLGYGQPLVVESMLEYLQKELATKAVIDRQPLPPSDMYITFADISTSRRVLGFQPKTSTAEGIHHFVVWFKQYYEERMQWERKGKDPNRNFILNQALQEAEMEIEAAERDMVSAENNLYRERVAGLRKRYTQYAHEEGISLPNLKKEHFIQYEGVHSPGSTVIKAPAYSSSPELLESRCLATEQCIAFTSDGEFKNHLQPRALWQNGSHDLFVADIDVCAADLHQCDRNADCLSTGPGTYDCVCHQHYQKLGRACVERYVEGEVSTAQREWQLCDSVDGRSWLPETEGKDFVFFPGLDSPGGDYLVVEGGEEGRTGEICRHVDHCLAYNSNGILKHSLLPPQQWVRWTNDPRHGLYVLDIDYCRLGLEQCPAFSQCARSGPGNYSCQCQPPFHMAEDGTCQRLDEEVEDKVVVIMSVDRQGFPGLAAALQSLWQHALQPQRLLVHIVLLDEPQDSLLSYLHCHNLPTEQLAVTELSSNQVSPQRRVLDSPNVVGDLSSAANFARFKFPDLFPSLHRALYLDVDTVVQGDITELWDSLNSSNKLMVAVPRLSVTYGDMFSKNVLHLFQSRRGNTFADNDPTFNAGVWGMNFDLWRAQNLNQEVEFWMDEHARTPLWRFGTQPILLLVAYNQWDHLPTEWNVDGLGWNKDIQKELLDKAKLLHWSGKGKPWLSDGLYQELWTPHQPVACAGQGRCEEVEKWRWRCVCEDGYSGQLCQQHLHR